MKPSLIIPKILSVVQKEAEQEASNRSYERGLYRASEIGGCPRALQYATLGYPSEVISPQTQLLLRDGQIHEDSVRNLCTKIGTVSSVQQTVKKRYKFNGISFILTGTLDFIFEGMVVDVKGLSTFVAKKISRMTNSDFFRDFQRYVWQVTVYLDILNLKTGILFIKDKNDSQLQTKIVKYSPDIMDKILERAATIHTAIKNKKLMDRPYKRSDWQCKKCPFRMECWNLPMENRTW